MVESTDQRPPSKWLLDFFNPHEVHSYAIERTLVSHTSSIQDIEVVTLPLFGRALVLNGELQSAELDEYIYHETLVHPIVLAHPDPKRVLIIGGGEGATLRETLRHKTVEKAVMVDIDEDMVRIARDHLPSYHAGAYEDPRAQLVIEDGRGFVEKGGDPFDVIIVDINCPLEGGPAYRLFTIEFYRQVARRLRPGGWFGAQAGAAAMTTPLTYATTVRTLRDTFAGVFPYLTYVPFFAMNWGFCAAATDRNAAFPTPEELDRRIERRVEGSLRYYDGTTHQHMFNLPRDLRELLKKQERINRDDSPLLERFPGVEVHA